MPASYGSLKPIQLCLSPNFILLGLNNNPTITVLCVCIFIANIYVKLFLLVAYLIFFFQILVVFSGKIYSS